MKFQVNVPFGPMDPVLVRNAIVAADASALVKIDPVSGRLRVSGLLTEDGVMQAVRSVGYAVTRIEESDCCGGCG